MPKLDIDEELKQRAELLWRRAGAPKGCEHEFWARAARELIAEMQLRYPGRPDEQRLAS